MKNTKTFSFWHKDLKRTLRQKKSQVYESLKLLCMLSSLNALFLPNVLVKYILTTYLFTSWKPIFKYKSHLKNSFFWLFKACRKSVEIALINLFSLLEDQFFLNGSNLSIYFRQYAQIIIFIYLYFFPPQFYWVDLNQKKIYIQEYCF